MPVIKINDQQFILRPGQTRLGSGAEVDVRLVDDGSLGVQAIVEVSKAAEGQGSRNGHGGSRAVIWRAGDESAVTINGVSLGIEPVPLLHGDKVQIAGQELLYSDENKAGATELMAAEEIAALARPVEEPARPTASTGGRLVSLVDGKEYSIPATGIVIGRDASADVVVAQNDVSRRHAEIVPVAQGYEVRDRSTNGLLVNGARVDKSQRLARSDVLRIGSEEFRFYADALPDAPPAAAPPTPMEPLATPAVDRPSTASGPRRSVLAVLEIASGSARSPVHELAVPVVHIGRGLHNDIVIGDDSVSDAHAQLQLRNEGWYVVDMGTTNGTHVNGTRVNGERKLHGSPVIRFGSVTAIFRPRDAVVEARKGGQMIAGAERPQLYNTLATALAPVPGVEPGRVPAAAPRQPRIRPWIWVSAILALIVAAAFLVLNP